MSDNPSLVRRDRAAPELAEARFIPSHYEPNYAYPLLVMFHGRGGDERQMIASMPGVSDRNHVGLSLRGPELVLRPSGEARFGWGDVFRRSFRTEVPDYEPTFDLDGFDRVDEIEDAVFTSVRRMRRQVHIHSERVFLMGVGEGAAVAYRLALTHPERFAGVVAINGWMPTSFRPLARFRSCRSLRTLILHGMWNIKPTIATAKGTAAILESAGLDVGFRSYPTIHRWTPAMLADVDRWLVEQCARI